MTNNRYIPQPVFDTLSDVLELHKLCFDDAHPREIIHNWLMHCMVEQNIKVSDSMVVDYQISLNFLYSYRGSADTFSAYRRDIERLLQWSWFIRKQSLLEHKREDIEAFIEFCIKPLNAWIGLKNVARFKRLNSEKKVNPNWRPFVASLSKREHQQGKLANKNNYQFSQQALKVMFAILGSFYNFLVQEEASTVNPVALIRQKSKFIRKEASSSQIRRLSNKQWQTVIEFAKAKAAKDSNNERTVFILSCLYGMYLRISELVSSERWTPTMGDFSKDLDDNWWFKVIGKGNKLRQIAVSDAMLAAVKHYRQYYLGLTPYPMPNETTPLVSHLKNDNTPIRSTRPIRRIIQSCFDEAADAIENEGDIHEAEQLRIATVHWLRHTGISDDVKHRPREHVRDDAGHSSSAITDRYIDVELKERAQSAKSKIINTED